MTKGGSTYRVHFTGAAGGTAIALLGTDPTLLRNGAGAVDKLNIVDTARADDASALLTSTSLTGLSLPSANEIQQLVVDATTGTYTLTYAFPVMPSVLTATQATGGTLSAGTHFYKVTALTAAGESLASNLASAVTADGGAVDLTWLGIAGATGYRIYRGTSESMDTVVFVDTGSTGLSFHDVGGGAPGTIPTASTVLDHPTTAALAWNASAATVQAALEALPAVGTGNVVVTHDDERLHDPLPRDAGRRAPMQAVAASRSPDLKRRAARRRRASWSTAPRHPRPRRPEQHATQVDQMLHAEHERQQQQLPADLQRRRPHVPDRPDPVQRVGRAVLRTDPPERDRRGREPTDPLLLARISSNKL